jgi:hypothetical protein
MKHGIEGQQGAQQSNDECDHAQYHPIDGFGNVSPDPERNWAWSTSGSQYDWMDSHAPVGYLD